jgi:hypothetical protein
MDGNEIRKVMLEVVQELSTRGSSLQSGTAIREAANRLGIRRNLEDEQALLTFWHDLFRMGYLAWGYNIPNPELPFCHLTELGRQALSHLSRDPANPDGYLTYLSDTASLNPITESYIREALTTFNANCYKATAVMAGAAAESMVVELRDALVAKMDNLGQAKPKDLEDWRIKRVLDAVETLLKTKKQLMPRNLYESFEHYWSAFTHQIRTVRNEAGHPASIEPITQEAVHASLLLFPELAHLISELLEWINNNYA